MHSSKKCFAVGLGEHCKLFRALVHLPRFLILNTVLVPPCLLDIFTHLPSRGSGDQQKPDVLTSSCEERLEAAYFITCPCQVCQVCAVDKRAPVTTDLSLPLPLLCPLLLFFSLLSSSSALSSLCPLSALAPVSLQLSLSACLSLCLSAPIAPSCFNSEAPFTLLSLINLLH